MLIKGGAESLNLLKSKRQTIAYTIHRYKSCRI